jgi:hypothetical protein
MCGTRNKLDCDSILVCVINGCFVVNLIRWKGDEGSLSATLYQARADVFPASDASPIPSEMPENALTKVFARRLRDSQSCLE